MLIIIEKQADNFRKIDLPGAGAGLRAAAGRGRGADLPATVDK